MISILIIAPGDIEYAEACNIVATAWNLKVSDGYDFEVTLLHAEILSLIQKISPTSIVLLIDSLEIESILLERMKADPSLECIELYNLSSYTHSTSVFIGPSQTEQEIGPGVPDGIRKSFCLRRYTEPKTC